MAGPWYSSYDEIDRVRVKHHENEDAVEVFIRANAKDHDHNDDIVLHMDEAALDGMLDGMLDAFDGVTREKAVDYVWERDGADADGGGDEA